MNDSPPASKLVKSHNFLGLTYHDIGIPTLEMCPVIYQDL